MIKFDFICFVLFVEFRQFLPLHPLLDVVRWGWDGASVSTQVASHTSIRPILQGTIDIPSGSGYVASAPNAGYTYSREAGTWLRLHMVPTTWANAGMLCYLEGGILASPTTTELANVMQAMMAEKHLTNNVFTGINSILAKEEFKSLDGTPLDSIPLSWAPGQPDNSNSDEDCVAMTGAGALADVSCDALLPYFCRKQKKTCDGRNGYKLDTRTGSCYKIRQGGKTWRKAQATCHDEGSILAVINSDTEAVVLKELYATLKRQPNHVFVGFMRYGGEWATIYAQSVTGKWIKLNLQDLITDNGTGKTLEQAGYATWDVNEPNNNADHEGCGSIHPNGLLNDAPCQEEAPFICEITPLTPSV